MAWQTYYWMDTEQTSKTILCKWKQTITMISVTKSSIYAEKILRKKLIKSTMSNKTQFAECKLCINSSTVSPVSKI